MDCVKANKEIFQSLFHKYGDDSKSCGWEQKMIMRYKELYKEERSYHNPLEIFKFCIDELSPKVNISHHYEKCDVSVFVYK